MDIRTKRVYEPASAADGIRILVDRIWPRGVSKENAQIDHWMKDLAPSHDLRKWYRHDHEKWSAFVSRYHAELDDNLAEFQTLLGALDNDVVTLVFSSKETQLNNAAAFKIYIEKHLAGDKNNARS